MFFKAEEQRPAEPDQGVGIELLARLAQGGRSDVVGQRLVVNDLEETIELIANKEPVRAGRDVCMGCSAFLIGVKLRRIMTD